MRQGLAYWRDRVWSWFFTQETPHALALVRITLPCVLLIGVLPRWFHAREIYSSDGAPAPFWIQYGYEKLLPILPGWGAVALNTLLVVLLITSALGWKSRWSLAGAGILYGYFGLVDAIGTLTKYTVIGVHLLLLLSFSDCGKVWSLDAANTDQTKIRSACWPRRLIQILLGMVYLGAASTKVHTPTYFNGDQLTYWMLTNVNFANPLGEFLSLYPALLIIFCYITFFWEATFILLAWRGAGRVIMLSLGIVFHLMTLLTLGLIIFPLVFLSAYFSFLTDREARAIGNLIRRFASRFVTIPSIRLPLPLGSLPLFLVTVGGLCTAGAVAEGNLDPFRTRGPNGPLDLIPLSPERATMLLRNDVQVRPQDKFFSFDVGTQLVGGVLADRRTRFRHGEKALIQCRLIQPHEDLWIEVNLHDGQNRVIERNGNIVAREESRTLFHYNLTKALDAGEYAFVLRLNGQEVARRPFTLIE